MSPFLYIGPHKFFRNYMDNSYLYKQWNLAWNKNIDGNFVATNDQLSDFVQDLLVLIPNRSAWSGVAESAARRVVLLQLLSIHGGAAGIKDLDVMLLCSKHGITRTHFEQHFLNILTRWKMLIFRCYKPACLLKEIPPRVFSSQRYMRHTFCKSDEMTKKTDISIMTLLVSLAIFTTRWIPRYERSSYQ